MRSSVRSSTVRGRVGAEVVGTVSFGERVENGLAVGSSVTVGLLGVGVAGPDTGIWVGGLVSLERVGL